MKLKYAFILILFFCTFHAAYSQNIAPVWSAVYQGNGDNSDRFNKIVSDGEGNFVAVGYTIRPGNYRDLLTVKFNANGDTLWWRTKNGKGNGDDEATTVGIDASGNVYVSGYADGGNSEDDIIVIKYDAMGVVQWDTTWNSPYYLDDEAVELKIDGAGNCIVGGNAEPDTTSGNSDYVVLKYAPNGALLWGVVWDRGFGLKDELKALGLDASGNAYVTGRSANLSDDDIVTLKFDNATGAQVWIQQYNSGGTDRGADLVMDHAGNVVVVGRSGSPADFRVVKYSDSGIYQWSASRGAPAGGDDIAVAVAVDASDNIIVVGEGDNAVGSAIDLNFMTVKFSPTGTFLWSRLVGSPVGQNDVPNDVVVDAAGNIFITGKSDSSPILTFVDNDWMTVMYDASGTLQWNSSALYHAGTRPNDDDIASSLIVDGSNLYVVGGVVNNVTQKDASVIKYDIASGNSVWIKNYNGQGDFSESAKAIVVDANGNSYVAGYSFVENKNLNATLAKIDASGNIVCTYQYNGDKNDDDEFECLALSSNGIIYAAGYTKVVNQKRNILLVKWDPSFCDTVWTRTYDNLHQSDRGVALVLDAAGNVYLTGRSDSNPNDTIDDDDIVTFKYDASGNMLWNKRFNGSGSLRDEPAKIIFDNNGDLLVAGRTENVHDDDFIVIKYNASTGNTIWPSPAIYQSPFTNDDRITDIAVDANNNIFVAGYSQTMSGNNVPSDPVLIKLNSSGAITPSFYSYVGGSEDEIVRIAVDINGKLYALFKYDADNGVPLSDNYDYLLQRFDSDLVPESFSVQYNSPVDQDDVGSDLTISSSGDIYITGTSEDDTLGGRINKNWVTIGFDPSGTQIFYNNFDPHGEDDSPKSMIIYNNQLWICGYTGSNAGHNGKDLTVNKWDLFGVGVQELAAKGRSYVYPNPFTSQARIFMEKNIAGKNLTVELYDVMGKRVDAAIENLGNSIRINRSNLSSGLYSYRISDNEEMMATGKFIIN